LFDKTDVQASGSTTFHLSRKLNYASEGYSQVALFCFLSLRKITISW